MKQYYLLFLIFILSINLSLKSYEVFPEEEEILAEISCIENVLEFSQKWEAKKDTIKSIINDHTKLNVDTLSSIIINESIKYETLDYHIICATIIQESGFQQNVISSSGACGYMQLMPRTAEWIASLSGLEYSNIFNAKQNIQIGCNYLSSLVLETGSMENALASYNCGPTRAKRKKYVISSLPEETQKYIPSVLKTYNKLKG